MHKLLHCNAGPRQPRYMGDDKVGTDNAGKDITDDRIWVHCDVLQETRSRNPKRRGPERPEGWEAADAATETATETAIEAGTEAVIDGDGEEENQTSSPRSTPSRPSASPLTASSSNAEDPDPLCDCDICRKSQKENNAKFLGDWLFDVDFPVELAPPNPQDRIHLRNHFQYDKNFLNILIACLRLDPEKRLMFRELQKCVDTADALSFPDGLDDPSDEDVSLILSKKRPAPVEPAEQSEEVGDWYWHERTASCCGRTGRTEEETHC